MDLGSVGNFLSIYLFNSAHGDLFDLFNSALSDLFHLFNSAHSEIKS